jgi:transglutaminase-like putative cysteine protease
MIGRRRAQRVRQRVAGVRGLLWSMLLCATLAAPGVPAQTPASQARPELSHEEARAYLLRTMVDSPYRIPPAARTGEIRYRLKLRDGRNWVWPQTGEQRAIVLDAAAPIADGAQVELRICADCGREPAPDAAQLQAYLAANAWVRSDHKTVRRFARQHARVGDTPRRMRALVEAIRKHMDGPVDSRRNDDAVTALRTRSGDCTEFAVLLAAAARSLGIPARVVYGMAYASRFTGQSHVFSPHVWVQAWDGARWVSYDAGLGEFGSGHIALFLCDGTLRGQREVNLTLRALEIVSAEGIQPRAPR